MTARAGKRRGRSGAILAAPRQSTGQKSQGIPIERSKMEDWLPHPRTGIYVPKGHEWVMEDVPENAASFSQTYWLRNVDGVEKPIHCLATNLYPATQEGLDQVLACCDDN
ncbi:hypothetical protein OIU77_016626 [Salix suchowensis]|uniref:Uncharacterized protein n=1 Tax=Salix suchowensis TaxID=1278906 RepID=A0ABQ8ZKZ8_9ROSI|nr:hypothetical protein OIU77_016626 [Salix suchowensis]